MIARPLIYSTFQSQKSSKPIIQKLRLKGYKSISRGKAIGEETIGMLNTVKKSYNLKLMRSLEFDPYFCELSGFKQLSQALKKFKKTLVSLNLMIRRVTTEDEIEYLGAILPRLMNLKKLRIEFPKTQGISANDIKLVMRSCGKCDLLKSLEVHLVGISVLPGNFRNFGGVFERLQKLENIMYHVQANHVPVPSTGPKEEAKLNRVSKPKNIMKLKSLTLKFSLKIRWTSYFDGNVNTHVFPTFLTAFATANPIRLSLIFDKFKLSTSTINKLTHIFVHCTNLRFLHVEMANMKLGEFETMLFAKGFSQCHQIEHLTFKYIDNQVIPMQDIFKFIEIMAKHTPFPRFDLFFRKLFYPEWHSPEVRCQLHELGNIKYSLTKQSIHISKIQPIDE